ncbi:MAG: Gfo/Idh/MocA family oxidoreductase [Ignavibacteriales bacterium]|nr:Gfo/Idh/MocA family oxidoreductase [Ignavibacteriales bacterium]
MVERKVRVAIVGCGKVARLHAAALMKVGNAHFVAVQSRTMSRGKEFASVYGVEAYDDIGEMIEKSGVEAIIVCTPHPFHAEAVSRAADLGVHSLVEKPLAASLQDCDSMIENCRRNNVKLGTVSQRRFYAPVQRMKQAILDGKIGRPVFATTTMLGWRDKDYYDSNEWRGSWAMEGGGVLVNQAPHQLDIFQWFMGPIDEVYGIWRNLNHPYIEVEDTALAIVKFKSGAVGTIILSNSQKPGLYGKVHVHGENGASIGVQTDGGAMFIPGRSSIAEPPLNDLWTVPGEEAMIDAWRKEDSEYFGSINATEHYFMRQHEDFCNAVINDADPLITGIDGRRTVEIFTAIYRSQRDNKPVQFPLSPEIERNDFDGRMVLKGKL